MTLPFKIPFKFIRPFLHALDAEKAHGLTIKMLKANLSPKYSKVKDKRLNINLFGKTFENPVGLSAGFDKNAEVIKPMLDIGFGFVETGGVTTVPQEGLPKPRIFRDIKNEAVINKMNFPNVGVKEFKSNIKKFRQSSLSQKGIVGIQIAKSADQQIPENDFLELVHEIGDVADYLVVNISCPNTPGLRDLEEADFFENLISKIQNKMKDLNLDDTPLVTKFSPDLTDIKLQGLAKVCLKLKVDGVIISNTTTTRPDYLPKDFKTRQGGLSGKPLTDKSTDIIRNFYALTKGKIPIIGVGGISSAQDAYDKICAGASLIQIYSALIFQGPDLIYDINKGLIDLIDKDGFENLSDAIGSKNRI